MIKKIYYAAILMSLVAPVSVGAAEEATEVHGLIELGIRGVENNRTYSALFEEFRDMSDGIFGEVQLDVLNRDYYLQFDADNPGNDDQFFQLKGGQYGNFKYLFDYDEMPHNYSFDAITVFTGVGTNRIAFVANPEDVSSWTKFDYAVDHKSYGGEFEISLGSPFYFNVTADKQEQKGLRPYTVLTKHSNPRNFGEFPEPIDHTTDNLYVEGGYSGKSITASISGALSAFDNGIKYFQGNVDFTGNALDNISVLSPDNDYSKIAGDVSWRDLPLGSVLATSVSFANQENDYNATTIGYSPAMLALLPSLNRSSFDGDVDNTSAAIALSSRPMAMLDTKVYYNYFERDNKSSVISYGPPNAQTNNARELLSYDKNSAGVDVGYRLPARTKLEAGYEYRDIDRSTALPAFSEANALFDRYDNPESTTDDIIYAGVKNSPLDWLTAKLKYTWLDRDSDIDLTNVVSGAIPIYTTRFDAQDKTMDQWKIGVELYPLADLDLGLDLTYEDHDYDYNNSSRTDETWQKIYTDMTWRATSMVTLNGFVGFEDVEIDTSKRLNLALSPQFIQTTDDDFWTYGVVAKLAATEQLSFVFSWQHDESDGALDFTSLTAATVSDVSESDDYSRKQLEAKAIYAIDPKLKLTLGYLYEKFDYQDFAYNNYTNLSDGDYLSNLYADRNYEANVGYMMVSYGF